MQSWAFVFLINHTKNQDSLRLGAFACHFKSQAILLHSAVNLFKGEHARMKKLQSC